ncbi:uncharacterized protein TNCV_4299421 [Trichonephila clavipes]|nr:uncharacterized protein TNCV_4299421 [Trichonephila clavipes]
MLINAHLSNLLNLTPVRNDRAETQIRSLASLGVKGESYSNLLTPILLKQIPSELVLEFNRSQKDKGTEYLTHLQTRAKWVNRTPNLMENQLVLLKDPNTKPLDWPMGRIIEVFPGSDGLVRVVNVKPQPQVF